MDFSYDSSQLEIGEGIVSSISSSLDSYSNEIKDSFDKISEFASKYKIDLSDTIKLNDINTDVDTLKTYLSDVSEVALKDSLAIEAYNSGEGSISDLQKLFSSTSSNSESVNPSVFSRLLYTGAMGVFKFGEGFLEFFEDLGDCAIVLGSGVASLLGKKDVAQSWRIFASENLVQDFVENNSTFEKINKYSYFDKDSVYADVFKIAGKATAAVTTGKVASKVFKAVSSTNTTLTADKVYKTSKNVSSNIGMFGNDTKENLKSGMNLKSAVTFAGASMLTTNLVNKVVSPKISSKVGEALADTKVGDVVRGVDNAVVSTLGDSAETFKSTAKKAVDYSISETKSKTGNLVSDDGNEKTTEDAVAQDVANMGIDTTKKTLEKTGEAALEKTVEETSEDILKKTAEKVVTDSLL